MRLSCREASRLISDELDRPLLRHERIRLRVHLLLCGNCRHFRGQMAVLRAGLREGRKH